jgi:RNA polymerase sigma-70 factor (ECF subfamily)
MAGDRAPEPGLLDAVRQGDEDAFGRLVEPYRAAVHAHCYRMLGSLFDADDALQETLLRAWRALPRFQGQELLRPWLYRIATNVCLDALARQRRRGLPIQHGHPAGRDEEPGEPLAEPVWVEPYPDQAVGLEAGYASPEARYEQREAVELAFIAALQHLPPSQRAVLVLRDVLGFSAKETAGTLATTVASVNSALQRARRRVGERMPARSQQATLRVLGDERVRAVVAGYLDAWERGDVHALVALLAEDATFQMPPYPTWWRGREVIAAFAVEPRHRYLPTQANGQAANAAYRWDAHKRSHVAEALEVLTLEGTRVKGMTAFMMPQLFQRFGLPDELPGP